MAIIEPDPLGNYRHPANSSRLPDLTNEEIRESLLRLTNVVEILTKQVEELSKKENKTEVHNHYHNHPTTSPTYPSWPRYPGYRPPTTWLNTKQQDCGCPENTVCGSVVCPRAVKVTCETETT